MYTDIDSIKEITKKYINNMAAFDILKEDDSDAVDDLITWAIATTLSSAAKDVLAQCVSDIVDCGDLCSKVGRSELMELECIVPVCRKEEQGFYAATYRGYAVYKALKSMDLD